MGLLRSVRHTASTRAQRAHAHASFAPVDRSRAYQPGKPAQKIFA